ncbi:hypothetical protein Lser_V15G31429 [Lactuca serriola]
MNGLRSEWKAIVSIVKAHEQFKSYSLVKLVGILRSHEDEVTKEVKIGSSLGSLKLVVKGKKAYEDDSKSDLSDSEISKEDKALLASNPKKFYKKNFSRYRNKYRQGGNSNSKKARNEGFKNSETDEEKKEKKVLGKDSYRIGLEKIEDYIKFKEDKKNAHDHENISEFDESKISEISVEDEVDCLEFVQNNPEPKKKLIYESSIEFVHVIENKGSSNDDNADGCDEFFWSGPIDNSDETRGLSEITSWKTKGKYVSKPLNQDVKDKSKVVLEPNISLETHEANVKKEKKSFSKQKALKIKENVQRKSTFVEMNLCDAKVEVFRIKKGNNHALNQKSFWVMHDEKYDSEWYIDIRCSRHIIGRREELREFKSLKDGDRVKFGNNATGEMKGYRIITNGEFSIWKVAYVEGLQHNLISVSQLVVGTGLKVSFNDEGSEIIEKKSKAVLLKCKRNGEMYPLNLKLIKGKPTICLLTKASSDDSWLWHRRISHLNFKNINKLVLGDLICGLALLTFEKENLCAVYELGKQNCQSEEIFPSTNPMTIPVSLLYEEYPNLFDEPENASYSESKAKDN